MYKLAELYTVGAEVGLGSEVEQLRALGFVKVTKVASAAGPSGSISLGCKSPAALRNRHWGEAKLQSAHAADCFHP